MRLHGAAAALRTTLGALGRPGDRVAVEEEVAGLRAALGPAFTAAWAEGQALPLGDAIALAQEEHADAQREGLGLLYHDHRQQRPCRAGAAWVGRQESARLAAHLYPAPGGDAAQGN